MIIKSGGTISWALRQGKRFSSVAIYLGFSLATSILGFLAVMVMSRLLPPSEYGVIGVFFSLLYFVVPLVSLSADGLISVNKISLGAESYHRFQGSYVALAYLSFMVLQIIFVSAYFLGVIKDILLIGAPLFGLIRFLASMAATEYIAEQRAFIFGAMSLLTSLLALLLTIAFIHIFGDWGGGRVLALFLADALMVFGRYKGRFRLLTHPNWDHQNIRQIMWYGLPSLFAVAGAWALNESDKIIVAKVAGLEAAGVYTAAASLAAIMMTFNQSLTNAMYPKIYQKLARGEDVWSVLRKFTALFTGSAAIFGLMVVLGYLIIGDKILPPHYFGAQSVFIALMVSCVAISCYRPFGLVADYYKLARIRAVSIIFGGICTICIGYLGVRQGGIAWAAISIGCGYMLMIPIIALALHWRKKRSKNE